MPAPKKGAKAPTTKPEAAATPQEPPQGPQTPDMRDDETGQFLKLYDADNVAEVLQDAPWFRKSQPIQAVQLEDAFAFDHDGQPVEMPAGSWLARDSRGYPYGIADEEFQAIYEPAPATTSDEEELQADREARASDDLTIDPGEWYITRDTLGAWHYIAVAQDGTVHRGSKDQAHLAESTASVIAAR